MAIIDKLRKTTKEIKVNNPPLLSKDSLDQKEIKAGPPELQNKKENKKPIKKQ